jgi:pyrroline-5-carboxylate reductase
VVILAVKPQVMHVVCSQISAAVNQHHPLLISIAAGITTTSLQKWLGSAPAVVRCMPNTPALLQLGASGLAANAQVNSSQRESAEQIMQAVGISLWVDAESDLDAVTAISGSGPAYFFYFIELLEAAGVKLGLPQQTAARLARQTALGAATMAHEDDVVKLRAQVTSMKGTTEQAILSFQHDHLDKLIINATAAAHRRSLELAQELSID